MEMNCPDSSFSPRQDKSLLRIASQIVRSGFDNPQRIGCPASQTLKLLARRSPSVAESPDLIDHIAICSPCFIEYSRCRNAHKRRVAIWVSLASSALLVVLCFLFVRAHLADWTSCGTKMQSPAEQSLGPRFALSLVPLEPDFLMEFSYNDPRLVPNGFLLWRRSPQPRLTSSGSGRRWSARRTGSQTIFRSRALKSRST